MIELFLILKAWYYNLVESLRNVFHIKKVGIYHSTKKYFKKGDSVITEDGHKGQVWQVYVEIKTGKPVGCSVIWETSYKGNKATPFLPVEDHSPDFNPIIRKNTDTSF